MRQDDYRGTVSIFELKNFEVYADLRRSDYRPESVSLPFEASARVRALSNLPGVCRKAGI